ncbi:transmembrane protein 208-like [Clavelina lepadiformis]|uniref:Transmembrane protein 208 n=1 Tax=Clavelina lepadiformis TaxID=159417 RepID=A0ABP0GUZ3_CLALP
MPATKGKQGTKGAKQIKAENTQTFDFYSYVVIGGNIPVILWQFIYNYSAIRWLHVVLFLYSLIVHMLCMKTMSSMFNSGLDLNMEAGMAEHVKDILLITVACQVFSCFSLYFWLIWLVIPGVGLYKLWVNILAPWIFQAPEELTDKQKRKMEKKRRF